jgi:hypothetical protein
MNTRCKPGDLAIIISDVPQCADNIGRVVAVSGPPARDHNGHITWLIQPVTPKPYLINTTYDDSVQFMGWQEPGIEHPDQWMIPIRPEDLLDEVEESVQLPFKTKAPQTADLT